MRYVPSDIVINSGDAIKFVNVSGGPHNIAFDPAAIPAAAQAPLAAAMPYQLAPLMGQLIAAPNDAYTITFTDVPAGKYPFFCSPIATWG